MTDTRSHDDLASGLRLAVMRLARRLRAERAADDLTLSQLATLASLGRYGPLTPGELAAHERVRPPSMTRLVGGLEQARLVTRSEHPTDGRQVLVALSAEGEALLEDSRRRKDAWLTQLLRELPAEDLAALDRAAAVLDRLAAG